MLTAFEIQVLNNGDWKIDSIFDDEELAKFEANRVFGRGIYDGVRVVQEIYNEITNTAAARTVAQMGKSAARQSSNLGPSASDAAREVIIRALKEADAPAPERHHEEEEEIAKAEGGFLWWLGLISRSILIAAGGLVLLFLLRLLYELI